MRFPAAAQTRRSGDSGTFDGQEDDARVVVGDHVGVAVLGLVHFEVGVLPRELLARVDGLQESGKETEGSDGRKSSKPSSEHLVGQIRTPKT